MSRPTNSCALSGTTTPPRVAGRTALVDSTFNLTARGSRDKASP